MKGSTRDFTELLSRVKTGDRTAVHQLLPLVYGELRGLARAVFSDQSPGHTLQPTALVHEAWLKLAGNLDSIDDKRHFMIVAGKAMRQVIANHARDRRADKRGGLSRRVTLETTLPGAQGGAVDLVDLVDLDDALRSLAAHDERHAAVAELRLFSGLTIDETAEALSVSPRTVDSAWAMAKAWLVRALDESA